MRGDDPQTAHLFSYLSPEQRVPVQHPLRVKTVGLLRKLRHRGVPRVAWVFTFTAAAYNLVRLRRLVTP